MALVNCPECGAQISSNAEQCINCGCKITCCPECGRVHIGETDTCTGCGYVFIKTAKNDNSQIEEQFKQISKLIDADKKNGKRISIIQKVIGILGCIILVIGVILFMLWKKSDSIDKLLKMNSLFNVLKALTVIGCTCALVSIGFDDLIVSFFILRRAEKIKTMQFDCKAFAESGSAFAVNGSDAKVYATSIKELIFINENPQIKKWYIIPETVHIIFYILTDICISTWIIGNLKGLFAATLLGQSYDIDFIEASFFCAITFFVLGFIVAVFILQTVREKAFKKWCGENSFN